MSMRQGTEMTDSRSRSEIVLDGERRVEREQHGSGTRRLGVEERGGGLVVVSENGVNRQLRNSRQDNDQGVSGGGNDTTSKFQWTSLLRGSGSPMVGGVERGFRDSGNVAYGRRYDEFVEGSVSVDNQTNRNVCNYSRNGGGDEYRGVTRNVTGMSIVEPDYIGHSRNATDLRAEDHRNSRNVTDLRAEDPRNSRNMTGCQVEDAEYKGRSRNLTGLPVEDAEYRRIARTAHSVEGADYQRHARSVAGHSVDYGGGRSLVREYPQDVNRHNNMKSYEDGNFIRYRSGDNSPSITPRSQSSDRHNPYRGISSTNMQGSRSHQEGFHHPSDGPDGSVPRPNCHGSHRIVCSTAGTNVCLPSMGVTNRRADYNQTLDRHLQHIYPDNQVSRKVYKRVMSKDNFDTYENVAYYDGRGDVSENDALDPPLPKFKYNGNSPECHLEEDRLHSSGHTLHWVPMVDINVMDRTAHEMEYDGVHLESMNDYLEYRPEISHETLLYEEKYPSEFVEYGVSPEDQRWDYVMLQEGVQNLDESLQADLYDQPKRQTKRKHEFVGKTSWPKQRTSTLGGRGALSYENENLPAEPENERAHQNKRSSHHVHSKANARMSRTEPKVPFGGLSKELQSRLSKPCESGSNDIKTRLKFPHFVPRNHGPQPFKFMKKNVKSCIKSSLNFDHSPSVTPRHVKAKPNSAKKRLKSAPHVDVCQLDPQVSHPGLSLEPQQKLAARGSGTTKETGPLLDSDTDHSILKVKPTEKDPPENSEELKRHVDHWFLKCMLYLNANPGRHKKFMEQGNVGTLKCVICSSVKEFTQTKDVATHAFTSLKVGLRAPHLGFHRALCFLMGWDPEVAANGRWVCKSLPDAEAQVMKEDIILWPPVFVIHSGSTQAYDTDQSKISIELLENILRDMGLSEGKATVCYGKPGNPNIMLLKFSGTLSGLQEAERLHNVLAEKKHGKTELLEIAAAGGSTKELDQEPEDKVEDVLYGYLGTVEDFDKLNYDMRQRCVAKSKKEIFAHVDNAI